MIRKIPHALAVVLIVASSACSDKTDGIIAVRRDPLTPPSAASAFVIPEEGQPTYYEYETTISGSGGLPGWALPSESHSRSLREVFRWSGSTGFWEVENQYATREQHFDGFVQSTAMDVSRAVKRRASIVSTSRAGSTLSTSSQPPIDLLQHGSGPLAARLAPSAPTLNRIGARTGPVRTNAPTFRDDEVRASRADRMVSSAKGKARELALLSRQFGLAQVVGGGVMEFRKKDGVKDVLLHFDPSIGAVTRIVRSEGGKRVAEISRHYQRQHGTWVLASVETQTFDDSGKRISRLVQDITNIVIQ